MPERYTTTTTTTMNRHDEDNDDDLRHKLGQLKQLVHRRNEMQIERDEIERDLKRVRACLQQLQNELAASGDGRVCHTCLWQHGAITLMFERSGHYCDECLAERQGVRID